MGKLGQHFVAQAECPSHAAFLAAALTCL
jgi:hypothetical protein